MTARFSLSEYPAWQREGLAAASCAGFLALALGAPFAGASAVAPVLFALAYASGMVFPASEAAGSLRRFRVDVDFLMLLVAAGAWALGHPAEGAALLVLFGISRALESWAEARTEGAIEELSRAFPREASLLDGAHERRVALDDLRVGDLIRIHAGEMIPVDVEVVSGTGDADLSSLTGESDPVTVRPGSALPSGGVNGSHVLTARVVNPSRESAWQKVLALIENTPERRSRAEHISARVGRWYTAFILTATIVAFGLWWQAAGLSFETSLYRAMALLVAGSPCALVLSVPSAVFAAISASARRGVLFQGGRGLMAAAEVRTVALDKTGTLTTGTPRVAHVSGSGAHRNELLGIARALANASRHPASQAVAAWAKDSGIPAADVTGIHEIPGDGMAGIWRGCRVTLGRPREADGFAASLRLGEREAARFALEETLRPGTAAMLRGLADKGIRSLVLSGDHRQAVERLAASLDITDARGELTPADKHRLLREARANGGVMMVGDGINDVPALKEADVGVAIGLRGTSAALAEADIVLAREDLRGLCTALEMARRARRVMQQNMAIAVGAAAILVTFAAFGQLPLLLGVFGHEGGTVLVVLNSLRLLRLPETGPAPAPPPSPAVALQEA